MFQAIVVGRAVDVARLHAAAGQPPGKRLAEVVAALGVGRVALAERRAAELAAPDDERVVEQSALLEILHQRGRRGVGVPALLRELREEIAVLVPAGVHELHEPHAALEQPPGDQAVVGERALHCTSGP